MDKWTETDITRRLKIRYPIILGPLGRGNSTAALVAGVSNAGGLGSFGANELAPEDIVKTATEIRKLTDKPFNLNLWVSTFDAGGESLDKATYDRVCEILKPFYKELNVEPPAFTESLAGKPRNFDDQVAALIEAKPDVFSFVFGIPSDDTLKECRKKGIITVGAATNVTEALALEEAGVDLIAASGFEAGGHRPSFLKAADESLIGTFALVPQIVNKVKVPVIAAGGIADGRGVAAALVLGASAAQIGTAFLACDESGASDFHRELLFREIAGNTALTKAFTGRTARGIFNRFASEMKEKESTFALYPAHTWIVAPLRAAALAQGRADLVGLWAGQAAPLVRYHKVAELFSALVRETSEVLHSLL